MSVAKIIERIAYLLVWTQFFYISKWSTICAGDCQVGKAVIPLTSRSLRREIQKPLVEQVDARDQMVDLDIKCGL